MSEEMKICGGTCREMTSKELIEASNIENKELILSRMKSESVRTQDIINAYENTVSEQRDLIVSYRTVLTDMIYSNFLNRR